MCTVAYQKSPPEELFELVPTIFVELKAGSCRQSMMQPKDNSNLWFDDDNLDLCLAKQNYKIKYSINDLLSTLVSREEANFIEYINVSCWRWEVNKKRELKPSQKS